MFKSNKKLNIKLLLILLAAFFLRYFGMSWDNGFHLHPDERMIIMVADQIHFFDKLNPHFFNYGSLPIYLLKGISQLIGKATYQGMIYVGRSLSILFDLGTIFLIYRITRYFFKKEQISLFAAFIYAIAFFPIQNSHFYTVDIMFTFFVTFLLYLLLLYAENHSLKYIFLSGITFAALLATKFTGIIFLPIVVFVLLFSKKLSLLSILNTGFWILIFILFTFIFMPYAFLDFSQFVRDISLQLTMNRNAFIFPYTLQYVGTLPYWYYLKNIFMWGVGPIISVLSFIGIIATLLHRYIVKQAVLFFLFYLFYFLVIGVSAVKFMRYMLPLYPFIAIIAGYGLYKISNIKYQISKIILLAAIGWTFMFINIYSRPNTRVTATEWILKNIPSGSTLAVEYWDDYLPIYGSETYHFNELHLYDLPDNSEKWRQLNKQIQESDYLIIASNRLYTPLQKLANYPKTAEYYRKLFNGGLNLTKVAEFSVKPGFQISNFKFQINDSSADESFTVFDHPKVMIFKKL